LGPYCCTTVATYAVSWRATTCSTTLRRLFIYLFILKFEATLLVHWYGEKGEMEGYEMEGGRRRAMNENTMRNNDNQQERERERVERVCARIRKTVR
jgi:hypothetical protein